MVVTAAAVVVALVAAVAAAVVVMEEEVGAERGAEKARALSVGVVPSSSSSSSSSSRKGNGERRPEPELVPGARVDVAGTTGASRGCRGTTSSTMGERRRLGRRLPARRAVAVAAVAVVTMAPRTVGAISSRLCVGAEIRCPPFSLRSSRFLLPRPR